MIHFLVWIIVAGFAGFVASKLINKSGAGLFMDIILGIVGGFIVSHVPALASIGGRGGMGGFIVEVLVAIAGAMLVIFLFNMLFRRNA